MKIRIEYLLGFCFVLFSSFPGMANNFYVRQGASGSNSGSDWTNAWSDVTRINWNSVNPGDSIWIAGGTYGQLTIGKSGTTNNAIYIARVRSTNAVPASAPGWNSSYDSQVIINLVSCLGYNYWTLDGQIPYGGILVTNVSPTSGYCVDLSNGGANTVPSSYVTLLNLNISGAVIDNSSFSSAPETRCINWNFGTPGHGFVMSCCYLAYAPTLMSFIGAWDTATITHNRFTQNNNGGNSANHKNVIQSTGGTNVTLAYNQIYNWANEGLMFDPIGPGDNPNDGWNIYGNLIYWDWEGVARFPESQNRAQFRIRIFNNTFVDLGLATIRTANNGSWGTGCAASNNIVLRCGSTTGAPAGIGFGLGTDDYNLSDASLSGAHSISGATTNVFVNYAARNYHIVTNIGSLFPRNAGVALGAPYNIDFDGNVRGADGAWDIGAYEAGGSPGIVDVTPPTVSLTAPTSNTTVSNLVTLTATASDNTNGSGVASVTFLVDGVAVGSDSASPYSMTWNSLTVTNGTHTIQALAQDVAGNQAVSSSVIVTVFNPPDTTPPTVSLTAPAAGAVISNSVTLSATASDNSGGSGVALVTFLVDGAAVGSSSSASPTR